MAACSKWAGSGQLLAQFAADGGVDPLPVGGLHGFSLVRPPADVDHPVARSFAPVAAEDIDHLGVRSGADEAVTDPAGQLGRFGPRGGDHDRWGLVGKAVKAGGVTAVVLAVVGHVVPGEQLPDHRHRLFEHPEPDSDRGPVIAQDVLVQVLARYRRRGRTGPASCRPRWRRRGRRARDGSGRSGR